MHNRYLVRVILTSLVLLPALAAVAPADAPPPRCSAPLRELYSPRALRRLRTMLQLRVLEARRRRLALAQAVIERRATIDQLLAAPDDATILEQGPSGARLKHLSIRRTSYCW
jgi:hypothetical protein